MTDRLLTEANLKGFVWSHQSKTRLQYLRDNLPQNANIWQVGLLDVVLSEYPTNAIILQIHFYDVIT